MAELHTDIRYLKGVGETRAKTLQKLGIGDLESLLTYLPRGYEDRTAHKSIAELTPGESVCFTATVAAAPRLSRIRRGLDLVKLRVVDETGSAELTYFNRSYLKDSFQAGQSYTFYGKVEGSARHPQLTNPVFEKDGESNVTGCIVPIYPLTAGVGQSLLRRAIRQGLDEASDRLRDILPESVRARYALCHVRYAYENIHFPADEQTLLLARRRLAFEELFVLTIALQRLRRQRQERAGMSFPDADLRPFYAALPFSLTEAQRRAVDDCLHDMALSRPMNRLCQGDVGSGKTMVAAAAIYAAAKGGAQCAMMAPTEILAEQHFRTLSAILEPLGVRCALLTASTKAKERRSLLEQLAQGEVSLVIGTHALLTADVRCASLGLVVTDEQHRFGVAQRAALSEKGQCPHLLVMSATPIPRTLALMIYGDLDVSVIDELPPGRSPIDTYAVSSGYRQRIYAFVEKLLAEGRQAYIVCPMVEENGELPDERKAVTAYAETLQRDVFPNRVVRPIHGRLKPKEKDALMRSFSAGEIDILVSTTVIEVGVDVPNAAVMLIENAECFGLSQLHQLRGRVGRGKHKSYCILISDNDGEDNRARLKAMQRTQSGFAIAEEDLKLRGPGDFFGSRQHGLPVLKAADLAGDMKLLGDAREAAEKLLREDAALAAYPLLRERVERLLTQSADTLN